MPFTAATDMPTAFSIDLDGTLIVPIEDASGKEVLWPNTPLYALAWHMQQRFPELPIVINTARDIGDSSTNFSKSLENHHEMTMVPISYTLKRLQALGLDVHVCVRNAFQYDRLILEDKNTAITTHFGQFYKRFLAKFESNLLTLANAAVEEHKHNSEDIVPTFMKNVSPLKKSQQRAREKFAPLAKDEGVGKISAFMHMQVFFSALVRNEENSSVASILHTDDSTNVNKEFAEYKQANPNFPVEMVKFDQDNPHECYIALGQRTGLLEALPGYLENHADLKPAVLRCLLDFYEATKDYHAYPVEVTQFITKYGQQVLNAIIEAQATAAEHMQEGGIIEGDYTIIYQQYFGDNANDKTFAHIRDALMTSIKENSLTVSQLLQFIKQANECIAHFGVEIAQQLQQDNVDKLTPIKVRTPKQIQGRSKRRLFEFEINDAATDIFGIAEAEDQSPVQVTNEPQQQVHKNRLTDVRQLSNYRDPNSMMSRLRITLRTVKHALGGPTSPKKSLPHGMNTSPLHGRCKESQGHGNSAGSTSSEYTASSSSSTARPTNSSP